MIELFVPDDTDLVDAQALCLGHHFGHVLVRGQLVRFQVDFGLAGNLRRALVEPRFAGSARSLMISPFQPIVPSKSTSMRMISGGFGGGWFWFGTGMFIFTACVWIGIVMMNMISSTSITSISGVVLMSTITSPSFPSEPALYMDIVFSGSPLKFGGGSMMKPTFTMPARWQANTTRPIDS